MLIFVGKHLSFYPKDVGLFIFCVFYLNEKKFDQQVCLIKYVENGISNSNSHKKKAEREREREKERERERGREREREEQKHNPTSKTFLKILKNFHESH